MPTVPAAMLSLALTLNLSHQQMRTLYACFMVRELNSLRSNGLCEVTQIDSHSNSYDSQPLGSNLKVKFLIMVC